MNKPATAPLVKQRKNYMQKAADHVNRKEAYALKAQALAVWKIGKQYDWRGKHRDEFAADSCYRHAFDLAREATKLTDAIV